MSEKLQPSCVNHCLQQTGTIDISFINYVPYDIKFIHMQYTNLIFYSNIISRMNMLNEVIVSSRRYATSRKVTGSRPDEVDFF
jgi:hypothetical protein